MRYRFIQAEKASYPVAVLCRVLTVARSGYYAWCRRPLGTRAQQNHGLLTQIRICSQASRGRYGSPRIHQDLRAHGLRVGRHRVARLMRLQGLRSIRPRRPWRQSAGARLPAVVRANVLRRAFTATRPNEKWAADITYVPTHQGWLSLAVVIDLYSRRVVGWAMDAQRTTALTLTALDGTTPTARVGRPLAPFGSRQSVWSGNLSAPVGQLWNPGLDEPSRQLLG